MSLNLKNSEHKRTLIFSVICGLLGALLNLFSIQLFSELTLIFGPAFSILVALSAGPWWGVLAAIIASSSLAISWEHSYGMLLFVPEAWVVGMLYRRAWNELAAVALYWLVVAIPVGLVLVVFYHSPDYAIDLLGKYLLNSFCYTVIASALLWFFSVPARLGFSPARNYSLRSQIFTISMVSMAIPIMAIALIHEHREQQQLVEVMHDRLDKNSQRVSQEIERFIKNNQIIIEHQARILSLSPSAKLTSLPSLQMFHRQHPQFISMLIASPQGQISAFSSFDEDNQLNTLDFENDQNRSGNIIDRDYFQAAKQRHSFVSPAFKGRAKGDPIVTISAPVISPQSGELIAVIGGSLNLYRLDSLLIQSSAQQNVQNLHLLILDSNKSVVYFSRQIKASLLQQVDWQLQPSNDHVAFYDTPFFDGAVIAGEAHSTNGWQAISLFAVDEFNQLSRNNYHQFAMLIAGVIVLVALLASFLAYQINTPLQRLFKRIVNFEVTGKAYKPIKISPLVATEMAVLIRAHESAERRLRHAFSAEKSQLKKRLSAEKASEAKSNFLISTSHELRTPLNAISGFTQILAMEEGLSDESKELVNEINSGSKHLMSIINDILDMSKIETGKLELKVQQVNIGDLLSKTFPLLENQAKQRDVEIILLASDEDFNVMADELRLKQVLINLLSNAIKYNRSGGKVTISLHNEENVHCAIKVTDMGAGIAPEKLEELFTPFNRLNKENSQIEGYGIGLVISKRLLELMDGKIKVESEVDKGSCFSICLPLAPQQKKTIAAVEITNNHNDNDPKCSILYIEDNAVNALVMGKAMQRFSHIEFVHCADGHSGVETLKQRSFDFVFLDISLPDMDGYDILTLLQNDYPDHFKHVFAVSANALADDIKRGLAAGFNEYVTKPIDFDLLFRLVFEYAKKN